MRIIVKNLKGEKFHLDMQPSDCFLQVKNQINRLKQIPIQNQIIVYKNKIMEDKAILTEIGVKDQDSFVLMKQMCRQFRQKLKKREVERLAQSKTNKNTQNKNKQGNGIKNQDKVEQLVRLGHRKSIAEQVLESNNNDLQKAKKQLQQRNRQVQIQQHNNLQDILSDFNSLENMFSHGDGRLKQILQQNPEILKQLLGGQGFEQQSQQQEQQIQEEVDVHFTQIQEQSIQRLIDLGFTREQVVPVYLACQKSEQMAANILLNQQQNSQK